MIRTAIVAIFLSLYTLVLGPPLILYTLVTRSADLMYWVGVKGVVFITWVAGMRVRVEGLENIPAGVCMFAANHTSNADAAAIVGAIPRRLAIFGRKSLFDIPIVGLAFRLAKFVPSIAAIAKPRWPPSSKGSSTSRPVLRFWSIRREPAAPTAACSASRKALSSWPLKRASRSFPWPARALIA